VRYNLYLVGFCHGSELLYTCYATAVRKVNAEVLECVTRKKGLEFVNVAESFTGHNRNSDPIYSMS
jgi:hypothetical protein